ncbi:MAG: hypothetical protein ACXWLH_00365 [Candidatus Saccharimonadales bacterium]
MKRQSPKTIRKLKQQRNRVFNRFPILFILLGTFGVVSTYYGLQHILEKIPLLVNDPYIALGVGILLLLFTGTLYKRLG